MHKASSCIITCMDFRIHKHVQKFLEENGYLGKSDEIVVAGSTRDFIKPIEQAHGDYVYRQLDLSIKLHDPDEIIFIDHEDCGGYAQDDTIKSGLSTNEDKMEHKKLLPILIEKIKTLYPNKTLRILYTTLDGRVEILY
jgi:carbonic anhydrase